MGKLRDFKSLIYRQDTVNANSLHALKPVLEKRLPHQLEELKLIDCKIHAAQVCQLMEDLLTTSQIKKLALVGVHHNVRSFDTVV